MKQLSLVALLALFSAPAMAYVGPGLGMGVIGTIFGVLAAIVLAMFGLFWYPMKRALKRRKAGATAGSQSNPTGAVLDREIDTDTLPTQPQSPGVIYAEQHGDRPTDTRDEASDSATAKRTDSQVQ